MKHNMSPRALALVLAGLRALQQLADQCRGDLGDLQGILDGTECEYDQILGEEIDDLCEEINDPDCQRLWLAHWDVHNSGSGIEVWASQEAAVSSIVDSLQDRYLVGEGLTREEARRLLMVDGRLELQGAEDFYSVSEEFVMTPIDPQI